MEPAERFEVASRELTPKLALVAGMVYVGAADGHLDENEIGDIVKVVPDSRTLEAGLKYARRWSYSDFLEEAVKVLDSKQRLCLLLNAADLAMGDGHFAPTESMRLDEMAKHFEISEETLRPHMESLRIKNDLTVFP
jgi:uncharacterized tellurite resistance protein B-like protein